MLRVKRTRTTQPNGPVGIDWQNPITRGLVLADNAMVGFDEVRGSLPWTRLTRRPASGSGVAYSNEDSYTLIHDYDMNAPVVNDTTVFFFAQPAYNDTVLLTYGGSGGYEGLEYGVNASGIPNLWSSASGWTETTYGSTAIPIGVAVPMVASHLNSTGAISVHLPWGTFTATDSAGQSGRDSLVLGAYIQGGGGYSGINDSKTSLVLLWDRILSTAEARAILANPWQVFRPEEVFLSISVAVQTAVPIADVSNTGWVPSTGSDIYPVIGEAVRNDSTYASTTVVGSIFEVQLTALGDPVSSTGHLPTLILSAPGGGGITVRLREGTTTIADWTYYPPTTPTEYTPTLSGAEADSIVDYTTLTYQFESVA